MLQLVWGLFVLLLLTGACAVLASGSKVHGALLPLPLLAGSALLLYGFGIAGALRIGAALVVLLLAALWVVGLVKLRLAGFAKACRETVTNPGIALFFGGAVFLWVLFFVLQPMFTQWDEFTAWGLAPKMVVERGAFYVADPVNLKASFTYPATSLITFLFQPFGVWSEWACLAALDTLALACVAAATALPRQRWYSAVLVFAAGVLLPYFFRDPVPGAYATQYVNAMADLPMAMLFGGTLCLYLGTEGRRGIFWLTALPLALLTLTKDICFAYGLIAAFLIGLDRLVRAEGPFRRRLVPALLHGGGLALVVVAAFFSWSRYTAAVTPSGLHSDGNRLYYFTTNYPAACYVQDFDGENRREVFSFEGDIYPQFVYEGDSVYFVANGYQMNAEPDETGSTVAVGGDQIMRADLQTGKLETIPLTLPDDAGKTTNLAITGKYGDALCLYYEEIDSGLIASFLQNRERTRFLLDLETGQIQGMMEDRKRANQMGSSDGSACGLYAYLDIDWDTKKSFPIGSHTADAADGVPILIDFANRVEYHFPSQPSLSVGFSLHDGKLFYTRPADDGQSLRLFYFDFETQTEQPVPDFFQDYIIRDETENWFAIAPRQDTNTLPSYSRVLKSDYFAGNPALIEMGEIQL